MENWTNVKDFNQKKDVASVAAPSFTLARKKKTTKKGHAAVVMKVDAASLKSIQGKKVAVEFNDQGMVRCRAPKNGEVRGIYGKKSLENVGVTLDKVFSHLDIKVPSLGTYDGERTKDGSLSFDIT